MKRIFAVTMLVCLLLSGCVAPQTHPTEPSVTGGQPTDPTMTQSQPTEPSREPTETTQPTTVPTEPPVVYTNPLNGQVLDAPYAGRPVAVMLNNLKQAMPQHGVSHADILYEILAEGGVTRCMGVFSDIRDIGPMGAIRSARRYYVDIARSFDALYVHAGWSDGTDVDPEIYARDYLEALDYDHIDGVSGRLEWKYFYRDQDRLDAGYGRAHCLFITSQSILDYAAEEKYEVTRQPGQTYGMAFGEPVINGEPANTIKFYFNMGSLSDRIKHTDFQYRESNGLYYASQYDTPFVDGNTGNQLTFANVMALYVPTKKHTDNVLLVMDLLGSGEGYFATGGQIVPIVWHREKPEDPFTYTLTDGTPVTFAVGKTYIAVLPPKGTVKYQ